MAPTPSRSATFGWPSPIRGILAGWLLLRGTAALMMPASAEETAPPAPSFVRDIAPLLVERCLECHRADNAKGGYRVDTYPHLLERGESGNPSITPGHPEASHLSQLLSSSDPEDRMPQKSAPLGATDRELFRRWISEGARFDGSNPGTAIAELASAIPLPAPPAAYSRSIPLTAVEALSSHLIAVAGYREITLWGPSGHLESRRSPLPERIHAIRLHPDGRRLFFAGGTPGRHGAVGVVDASGKTPPTFLARRADVVLALALDKDGQRVAFAGTDREIQIIELATPTRRLTLTGHADWVLDLAFSPDGKRLVSASRDRTARVFDTGTGALIAAFRDHNESVGSAVFLGDGQRVATAGRDGRIRIWDASTGKAVSASKPISSEPTSRLVLREDRLYCGWSDGRLREVSASDPSAMRVIGEGRDRLLTLAPGPDASRLVAGYHDGTLEIWTFPGPTREATFPAWPAAK